MSKATSIILEFVTDKNHFMTTFDQTLSQLVAMGLNSSKFREGEVCAYQD